MKQPKSKKKNSKRSHREKKRMLGITYHMGYKTAGRIKVGKDFRKKSLAASVGNLLGALMARKGKEGNQNGEK